jgi:N-acetylglucosamine-6-sulfatase
LVKIPDYAGVRTRQYLYVEYVNGDRELYDVTADPDEMHNLAGTQPDLEAQLSNLVAALRSCRAATCRALERSDHSGP